MWSASVRDDVLIFHTIPPFPSTTKCHVPFTHKSKHILALPPPPPFPHCYWNIYDWSPSAKTSSSAKRRPWDYCTFCLARGEETRIIVSCCSGTGGGLGAWGLSPWECGSKLDPAEGTAVMAGCRAPAPMIAVRPAHGEELSPPRKGPGNASCQRTAAFAFVCHIIRSGGWRLVVRGVKRGKYPRQTQQVVLQNNVQ